MNVKYITMRFQLLQRVPMTYVWTACLINFHKVYLFSFFSLFFSPSTHASMLYIYSKISNDCMCVFLEASNSVNELTIYCNKMYNFCLHQTRVITLINIHNRWHRNDFMSTMPQPCQSTHKLAVQHDYLPSKSQFKIMSICYKNHHFWPDLYTLKNFRDGNKWLPCGALIKCLPSGSKNHVTTDPIFLCVPIGWESKQKC